MSQLVKRLHRYFRLRTSRRSAATVLVLAARIRTAASVPPTKAHQVPGPATALGTFNMAHRAVALPQSATHTSSLPCVVIHPPASHGRTRIAIPVHEQRRRLLEAKTTFQQTDDLLGLLAETARDNAKVDAICTPFFSAAAFVPVTSSLAGWLGLRLMRPRNNCRRRKRMEPNVPSGRDDAGGMRS